MRFAKMTLKELTAPGGYSCSCGRRHCCEIRYLDISRGAIRNLPEMLRTLGSKKPFLFGDRNTFEAAGKAAEKVLDEAGIPYVSYVLPMDRPKPGEWETGSVVMHFDPSCDLLLAVGSGVINDIGKVVSHATGVPNAVIGTAPSMDGYASNSSSMEVNKVKVTLYNHAPSGILLDTEILAKAPMRMLQAGFGDMIAKYIAICEWQISNIAAGEYYCEEVAEMMREALRKVTAGADSIPARDPDAIGAIAEGLVLAGIAMAYAQISRPASGLEHYFSHMWEMMALERDEPYDLHGIQVGVGTVLTLRLYRHIRALKPSREKAEAHMRAFREEDWEKEVKRVFGKTAPEVLEIEKTAHKNDPKEHALRLTRILDNWDRMLEIMDKELPDPDWIQEKMRLIGEPMLPSDLGISEQDTLDAFTASRDIRAKYLTSTLLWDLGEMEDFKQILHEELEALAKEAAK